MQGGAFLFPLFVDPADAAAADAREALHPLLSTDVADVSFDPARLAALLRGAITCGTLCVDCCGVVADEGIVGQWLTTAWDADGWLN
jgi:hypothetical protein